MLPPLTSTISAQSDSTKYSPGIDGGQYKDEDLLAASGGSGGSTSTSDEKGSGATATASDQLFRDTQGNVYHPSVTFAPAPSTGRPNLNLPALSFRGGAVGDSSNTGFLHPGLSNRRGSSRQAEEGFSGADFKRKRSLVRPERERVNPDARHFHYAQHSAAFQAENGGRVGVSGTGYGPSSDAFAGMPYGGGQGGIASYGLGPGMDGRPGLRRGKSILAREEGMAVESGLNFLKRGATMRRSKKSSNNKEHYTGVGNDEASALKGGKAGSKDPSSKDGGDKAPLTAWMIYCYAITCCLPGPVLKSLGRRNPLHNFFLDRDTPVTFY
jgi:chitin synthase